MRDLFLRYVEFSLSGAALHGFLCFFSEAAGAHALEAVQRVHGNAKIFGQVVAKAGQSIKATTTISSCTSHRTFSAVSALLDIAEMREMTRDIIHFIKHPSFPVDIRHNAKIERGALAQWAQERIK